MADSLTPWIAFYALSTAEKYGAQLSKLPLHEKKKKVQMAEVITFDNASYVWARVSDKEYAIPIKFSESAVTEFNRHRSEREWLTSHRGAILSISSFRLSHSRHPERSSSDVRLSVERTLIIECDRVSLLGGSLGENTFGHPKLIIAHPDINLWSEGLSKGGNSGNVLKDRLTEKEEKVPLTVLAPMASTPMPSPAPRAPPAGKRNYPVPLKRSDVGDLKTYDEAWKSWKVTVESHYREPPEEVVEPAQDVVEERSRSASPISGWEPTQEKASEPSSSGGLTLSLPAPTPAQRQRPVVDHTPGTAASSSYPGNETVLEESQAGSSGPPRSVARKIPRPVSPEEPSQTGRVLAPNSDTSSQPIGPLLGGMKMEMEGDMPWMSLRDIGAVLRRTASLRLHNDVN